ncbi:MAG: glycosyltransferase family 2 protein [Hyphomicrobiales bacterium]|nr:glycosyltransferase family 2 protein [Hyphomicrobiales bacterium]
MRITVVIPALNEEGNIGRLVDETFAVMPDHDLAAVIVVDDASTDGTPAELASLARRHAKFRYLRHDARSGQSCAVRTGVWAASSPIIATMDGDGQNDPADIMSLVAKLGPRPGEGAALVGGVRVKRKAEASKRLASIAANKIRGALFKDNCPDSGCGVKVFWRDAYIRLPFFSTLHRFMPAMFQTYGHRVDYAPVNDRPRVTGQSKYTNWGRALVGAYDLLGVVWLMRRTKTPRIVADSGVARATASGIQTAPASRSPVAHVNGYNAAGE